MPWFHCSKNITPPKMNECRLRRDRFKRKRNIFQPSIFRGYSLVFRGTNSEDAFLAIKAFGSFMSRHDSISIPVNQPLTVDNGTKTKGWKLAEKNNPALRMKKGNSSSKSLCFASSCQMFLGCIVGSATKIKGVSTMDILVYKGVLKELQARKKNRQNPQIWHNAGSIHKSPSKEVNSLFAKLQPLTQKSRLDFQSLFRSCIYSIFSPP